MRGFRAAYFNQVLLRDKAAQVRHQGYKRQQENLPERDQRKEEVVSQKVPGEKIPHGYGGTPQVIRRRVVVITGKRE